MVSEVPFSEMFLIVLCFPAMHPFPFSFVAEKRRTEGHASGEEEEEEEEEENVAPKGISFVCPILFSQTNNRFSISVDTPPKGGSNLRKSFLRFVTFHTVLYSLKQIIVSLFQWIHLEEDDPKRKLPRKELGLHLHRQVSFVFFPSV